MGAANPRKRNRAGSGIRTRPRAVAPVFGRLAAAVCVLMASVLIQGDNGRFATTSPGPRIAVDGDLSDWSENLTRHPIAVTGFGEPPRDGSDFEAWFRVQHDPDSRALHIAVEVVDDSFVAVGNRMGPRTSGYPYRFDQQDGCELYLDLFHHDLDSSTVQFCIWGDKRIAEGRVRWPEDTANPDAVRCAARRTADGRQYEWRVDLDKLFDESPAPLAGRLIGFDVAVNDKDTDGSFTFSSWGAGTAKIKFTVRLGDLLFLNADTAVVPVRGRIRWAGIETAPFTPPDLEWKICFEPVAFPERVVTLSTDREGHFATGLPRDDYRVYLSDEDPLAREVVELHLTDDPEPGSTDDDPYVELHPIGRHGTRVKIGPGKVLETQIGENPVSWTHWGADDGLTFEQCHSIAVDRDGYVWIGAVGGAARFDGDRFETFDLPPEHLSGRIDSIAEDRSGKLWFVSGHAAFQPSGESLSSAAPPGYPGEAAWFLGVDPVKNLWFATDSDAIRYDGFNVSKVTEPGSHSIEQATAFAADETGAVWVGGPRGLLRMDDAGKRRFELIDTLPDPGVHWIKPDRRGDIWVGTASGVIRIRPPGEASIVDGLAGVAVRCAAEDSDGTLWFGTRNRGVFQFDGTRWSQNPRRPVAENGVGTGVDRVNAILADDLGQLWIGTPRGVEQFDGRTWTQFDTRHGMAPGPVTALFEDASGAIWACSATSGISRRERHPSLVKVFARPFPQSERTPVLEDQYRTLWIGTGAGVIRRSARGDLVLLDKDDGLIGSRITAIAPAPDGGVWFGTDADGLPSPSTRAIFEDRDGVVWIVTEAGLAAYWPTTERPAIRINKPVTERLKSALEGIRLPETEKLLTFNMNAISFRSRPIHRAYVYRMKGHDDTWRVNRSGRAEYTLPPRGSYTFEAMAVDRDMNYSDPIRIPVEIHRSPARIGFTVTLCLFFAGSAFLAVVAVRERLARDKAQKALLGEKIHQNRQLEEARRTADRANEAKTRFLVNMSHEIRTPMNAILGYAQLLGRDAGLKASHRVAIDTIRKSGNHLLDLINDVLELSKIEAGCMELHTRRFDLIEMIQEVSAIMTRRCHDKGTDLRLELPRGKEWLVEGDEPKIREILINLIDNAARHTDAGTVHVRLIGTSVPPETGTSRFQIEIADSGTGIPEAIIDRIMQPYEQGNSDRSEDGFGLGLAICKRLVELMGGSISVCSEPGRGSCFTLTLTLKTSTPFPTPIQTRNHGPILLAKGTRVAALIVDDNRIDRTLMGAILTKLGCEVHAAASGRDALEMFRVHPADIVFIDLQMPDLDGSETAVRLRRQFTERKVRIVAVSAGIFPAESNGTQSGFGSGGSPFDDFIAKPYTIERLAQSMAQLLAVEFDFECDPESRDLQSPSNGETGPVPIPAEVLDKIDAALEIGHIEQLRVAVALLETVAGTGLMVLSLRDCLRRYDLNEFREILARRAKVSEPDEDPTQPERKMIHPDK